MSGTAGLYVAIEGGEGAGKSTQVERVTAALRERGIPVVSTREPGATVLGSEIRRLVLEGHEGELPSRRAEALLYAADRAEHMDKVVRPALLAGEMVIQDRSIGSTLAYQSSAGGLDWGVVLDLSSWATSGILPHLTIYLDIDPEEGLRRAEARGDANRFERKGVDFHEKVRAGFRRQAEAYSWVTLDATQSADEVHEAVLDLVLTQASMFGHKWA